MMEFPICHDEHLSLCNYQVHNNICLIFLTSFFELFLYFLPLIKLTCMGGWISPEKNLKELPFTGSGN